MRTLQRSLTFEVDYPEADGDVQPRHRLVGEWRESWGMEKELENGERVGEWRETEWVDK